MEISIYGFVPIVAVINLILIRLRDKDKIAYMRGSKAYMAMFMRKFVILSLIELMLFM